MPASLATSAIRPGFITLHGNQSEWLAHTVMQWLRSTPLDPLEQEVVLVQSNGMAEWFKMEMARLSGACAATRVELPSRFLWRTYRQVLGAAAVPRESPLDKLPMTWRLMKVLPALLEQPDFAPVEHYLREHSPTHERDLPLAAKLADLFDQYQNYRADWLQAWGQGQDVLLQHDGRGVPIPDEQCWQPQLWRAVLGTLAPGQEQAIRPYLHQRALARLRQQDTNFAGRVARRVVVFGMSHMPISTLQALAALSPYTQVILAIPNPCRYYWGDIIEGRELFRTLRRRQQARDGLDLGQVNLQDMHQHAHPLLAAWGRQGRDFIRLLDEVDSAEQTQQQFPQLRLDVFDETPTSSDTPMLHRVQQAIRDLEPIDPQLQQTPWPWQASDRSISFHIAHNRVRELEILHDQLLTWLAETNTARPPLQPRDIVVMVPDIGTMAPAIRAVFEQYKPSDPRYIPYDIADVSAQATSPLMAALEWLLKLPHQRCGMSELLDLLEVPAIAQRFGVSGDGLPKLKQWMQGAGIRWGLNQQHRSQLGLAACGEQNSAWFGLQRMLLAYATGALPSDPATTTTTGTPWAHIVPYTEVGGLEAEWAGSLAHLLQTLMDWVSAAGTPASPADWAERGRVLLDGMFRPSDEAEQTMLERALEGLNHWLQACAQAGFEQPLLLTDFRSAWLEAIDPPSLDEKFRAGGVTFCTLMPMRAIPFEVVCLLGMNDGDYPRRSLHSDFDLMRQTGQYRPGDRSRQHDDRQLMLEALLSARRALYISWTGRSIRDNTEQPPSVLVSQLRDYLSACWGQPVLEQLTTEYPLQAFSRSYFVQGSPLRTYAHEWRSLHHTEQTEVSPSNTLPPLPAFVPDSQVPLTLGRLTQFLRNPVKVFFRERLSIVWPTERVQDHDVEPLASDGLEYYQWIQQQIDSWPLQASSEALRQQIEQSLQRQRQAGVFQLQALGQRQQDGLQQVLLPLAHAWVQARQNYPHAAPRQALQLEHGGVLLQDWLEPLYTNHTHPVWLHLEPSKLLQKDGKSARPDKLLPVWLRLLAAAASGQKVSAVVVGQDARLDIEAIEPELAAAQWPLLLELWLQGMQRPVPLPLRTALAYVANQGKDPEQAAATAYEGSDYSPLPGEGSEPCLAREFPDFAALQASGEFAQWAETLYTPLLQWLPKHVHCHPHSTVLEPAAHADT